MGGGDTEPVNLNGRVGGVAGRQRVQSLGPCPDRSYLRAWFAQAVIGDTSVVCHAILMACLSTPLSIELLSMTLYAERTYLSLLLDSCLVDGLVQIDSVSSLSFTLRALMVGDAFFFSVGGAT